VAAAIATFAKEYDITHIILGRSRRPWYRRLFAPSVLDSLQHTVSNANIIVLSNT